MLRKYSFCLGDAVDDRRNHVKVNTQFFRLKTGSRIDRHVHILNTKVWKGILEIREKFSKILIVACSLEMKSRPSVREAGNKSRIAKFRLAVGVDVHSFAGLDEGVDGIDNPDVGVAVGGQARFALLQNFGPMVKVFANRVSLPD